MPRPKKPTVEALAPAQSGVDAFGLHAAKRAELDRKLALGQRTALKKRAVRGGRKPELPNSDTKPQEAKQDGVPSKPDMPVVPVAYAPAPKKSKKTKKGDKEAVDDGEKKEPRGVVYLGHIPHGFFERQMRSYFSQFGKVTRLRLSRSKKTTCSRGYAFVEFDNVRVAEIVAETMNNYLLGDRILKCKVVAKDSLHPATFRGANRVFRRVPHAALEAVRHNKERTPAQSQRRHARLQQRLDKASTALANLGLAYDFDPEHQLASQGPKTSASGSVDAVRDSLSSTEVADTKPQGTKTAPAAAANVAKTSKASGRAAKTAPLGRGTHAQTKKHARTKPKPTTTKTTTKTIKATKQQKNTPAQPTAKGTTKSHPAAAASTRRTVTTAPRSRTGPAAGKAKAAGTSQRTKR